MLIAYVLGNQRDGYTTTRSSIRLANLHTMVIIISILVCVCVCVCVERDPFSHVNESVLHTQTNRTTENETLILLNPLYRVRNQKSGERKKRGRTFFFLSSNLCLIGVYHQTPFECALLINGTYVYTITVRSRMNLSSSVFVSKSKCGCH